MKKGHCIVLELLVIGMICLTLYYDHPLPFMITEVRLPRLCMLLLISMMLGLSGYLLQHVTGNELADPSILGINQGSGMAIACVLSFTVTTQLPTMHVLPLLALLGGSVAAAILFSLSYKKGQLNMSLFILNGIGLNALLASGLILLINRTRDGLKIDFMMKWLLGNLWSFEWSQILVLFITFIFCFMMVMITKREFSTFALSEEQQYLIGVAYPKFRWLYIGSAVIMTSLAVAYGGGLTFIGLLAPHMAKYLFPQSISRQLLATELVSSLLIMTSDFIMQHLLVQWTLPQGSLLALLGAPYFIYLMLKK